MQSWRRARQCCSAALVMVVVVVVVVEGDGGRGGWRFESGGREGNRIGVGRRKVTFGLEEEMSKFFLICA